MAVWAFLRGWWRLRQRAIDCEVLWRTLVDGSSSEIRWAQNAMLLHCMSDPAWRDEMTEVEIYQAIAALTAAESAGNRSPWKYSAPSRGS